MATGALFDFPVFGIPAKFFNRNDGGRRILFCNVFEEESRWGRDQMNVNNPG